MARNPTAAQRAALSAFLDAWEPRLREAFLQAIYRSRATVDLQQLIEALERGRVDEAAEMLRIRTDLMSPLREAARGAYMAGGEGAATILPRQIAASFGFDGFNQRAVGFLERRGGELIQGLEEDSREAARNVMVSALEGEQNRSLRAVALDLVGRRQAAGSLRGQRVDGIVGLSAEMTDELIRARAILSSPDRLREYFIVDRETGKAKPRYARSNLHFLRTVATAVREGRGLTAEEIERGMNGHKSKLLKARGELIARDQAFKAQAESREEAMLQVLERSDVEDVTRRWQLGFPREHRPHHVALAGQVISIRERFDLGNGITARCPHDSDLPASETLNCRCSCVYRVVLN